jgi:multiple sugar transport system substrate-binding protein
MRWFYLMLFAFLTTAAAPAAPLWMQVWSYDTPGEEAYFEDLAAAWEAETGEKVRITMDGWEDAHDRIGAWFRAGEGPDLVVVPDIWLAEYAEFIAPFEEYVDASMKGDFFEVLYNKGIYKNHLLGLVWATSSKALFYRKDLFRDAGIAPPENWMDQLGAAVALHNPPDVYGIGLPGKREYETDDNFFFYFWSAGGEFFDKAGRCTINSAAGKKALRFYCDLANRYNVTQPELTTWSRKETRRLLEAGRLAMFATGPWGVEQMRKNAPDVEFGVVPLPADRVPVTQIITDHLVLAGHSAKKAEAGRFVRFAYQDAYRLAFAKLGLLPEKKSVAADPYFQQDPDWKVFIDVIPHGRTIPLIRWEKIGTAIREALYQALSGRKTPEDALDDLAQEIDRRVAREDTPASAAKEE